MTIDSGTEAEARLVLNNFANLGKIPEPKELIALCCIITQSASLTPQHTEVQDPLFWPPGYTRDRSFAMIMAERLRGKLCSIHKDFDDLFCSKEKCIQNPKGTNPNLRQRDLLEIPPGPIPTYEEANYFNNNVHEFVVWRGKEGHWFGKMPEVPPESWFEDKSLPDFDSGLESEYSTEGEM
jgi:hypothetical protein